MKAEFVSTIQSVSPQHWRQLWNTSYPFIQHEFLSALEVCGSTHRQTGWQPSHLILRDRQRLLAAMPLFIKSHSYGEYVFDWAWADAYHRSGLDYYPKLVTSIPFTPATGPRLAIADGVDKNTVYPLIFSSLKDKAAAINASSWHCLFPEPPLSKALNDLGFASRMGCQFHWFNSDYESFDEFLSTFTSRKRKTLNRERRRVREQGVTMEVLSGGEVSSAQWDLFYQFYQLTYFKRSGHQGYLGPGFFHHLGKTIPDKLVLVLAKYHGDIVAAALNFRDDHTLYGRYWGCRAEFDALHFEACYYRGIEYAIANGLQRFDPGAQGEHKIQRGFIPTPTWSNHWIADARFRPAIEAYLHRDAQSSKHYIEDATTYLPFKKEG
ncbi:MAG: GNAT family N-acetyltransferase [Exilibacterium sp.]